MDDDTAHEVHCNCLAFQEWGQEPYGTAIEDLLSTFRSQESSCAAWRREAIIGKARDTVAKEKQIKEKIAKFANVPMDCLEIDILERR